MSDSMWNYLKQWLTAGMKKRPSRCRADTSRFCGQIEQLEARTVLSASMETAAFPMEAFYVDLEVSGVIIFMDYEGPIAAVIWQPPVLPAAIFAAHWEGPKPFDIESPVRDPLWPNSGSIKPPLAATAPYENISPADQNNDVSTGAGTNRSDKLLTVLSASSKAPWDKSPSGTSGDVTARVTSYYSPLTTLNSTSTATVSLTSASLEARDAIFREYLPDSLLLTASGDSPRVRNSDSDLDDEPAVDKKPADPDDSDALLVNTEVATFLDALQRDRDAVDAVLAELHDFAFDDDQPTQDTSPTAERQHMDFVHDTEQNYLPAESQIIPGPQFNPAAGGMVLLEPSGDANSSAYDLTTVYVRNMDDTLAVPQGVEASIGMFRAIDIGTSDKLPTSRTIPSIAQPAATIRPSVSAENAPIKKSEQPS